MNCTRHNEPTATRPDLTNRPYEWPRPTRKHDQNCPPPENTQPRTQQIGLRGAGHSTLSGSRIDYRASFRSPVKVFSGGTRRRLRLTACWVARIDVLNDLVSTVVAAGRERR